MSVPSPAIQVPPSIAHALSHLSYLSYLRHGDKHHLSCSANVPQMSRMSWRCVLKRHQELLFMGPGCHAGDSEVVPAIAHVTDAQSRVGLLDCAPMALSCNGDLSTLSSVLSVYVMY